MVILYDETPFLSNRAFRTTTGNDTGTGLVNSKTCLRNRYIFLFRMEVPTFLIYYIYFKTYTCVIRDLLPSTMDRDCQHTR